jgi:TonB family protein
MDYLEDQLEQALRIALRCESPSPNFAQRVEFQLALQTTAGVAAWRLNPLPVPSDRPKQGGYKWSAVLSTLLAFFSAQRPTSPEAPTEGILFQGLATGQRAPASIAFAVIAHGIALALLFLFAIQTRVRMIAPQTQSATVDIKPWLPVTPQGKQAMGGGGGGGDHDLVEVSKGKLPQLAKQQVTPPQVVRNDNPKLAVEPTIVMPKNIPLPNAGMPNLGMSTSSQVQLASNGTGSRAGMGSGHNGGVGSGDGGGYGPGSGGGTGGGVYQVGGGVSAPLVLSAVDPEYSDEARRSKFTGVVVVSLVVDPSGLPQHVHVVRRLGMGLDEKAIAAVKQYKFKPAEYQGKPVPVEVNIEVNFQIY